ncbi:pollen-specific leucine-rich repeat extensin-like protein 2 [Dorcoceras hygrometricum]|uniref:Pollen-specific leucine-rich repeat extensin-like protein 2 n=1 Tax=Dorcoceras hygrometricum TaxID=472368 RepID=A0A2Z7CLE8_9LAMI|nr:pollen-specific leucine-rich repeat extensin-like protein 2 [Dorcoceras hygrometricum]
MTSSLFVNTLQVDFVSVLTMEHTEMTRMFKSLEDTGLRGFLEGTTFVFENAVTEFFINAKVIAGTVISTMCNQKLVITEDMFSTTFKLPTEGMTGLVDIPKETIAEMRSRFSATDVPFKAPSKKREMWIEYRLLHDIVAKSLCAKVGSFDTVTCEKFEFMVAISAGISVNWRWERSHTSAI